MDRYKHISFRKEWHINTECAYMLGECDAYVRALRDMPLKPQYRNKLLQVSLVKGAQATTAIEGNTLSQEEILKIQEGWSVPPSKEYLKIEVENILEAFNSLLSEVITDNNSPIISPNLIKNFHKMISKNLGDHLDAIPGQFRSDNRVVGQYRAPDYQQVPMLINKMCDWLQQEFHYVKGQDFTTYIIEAIVAHVYLEWIHPFGDGNGRTGRLLEFYILLRAGIPNIISHILSNFYNETRSAYYLQLKNSIQKKDLTDFILYAVRGFRDGLKENLEVIQNNQFEIFWHNHIYESFAHLKYTKKNVFKRKRELILQFPMEEEIPIDQIKMLTPSIAQRYATVKRPTILRDLKELQELGLLLKIGRKYKTNTKILKASIPSRKI